MTSKQIVAHFTEQILEAVQNLEEIGGPDKRKDYIQILENVQSDIQKRLDNCRKLLETEGEVGEEPEESDMTKTHRELQDRHIENIESSFEDDHVAGPEDDEAYNY